MTDPNRPTDGPFPTDGASPAGATPPADRARRRSQSWFAGADKTGFFHRSGIKAMGVPDRMFDGRPVIGICNTWSQLAPCNAHLRDLAQYVARGVYEAGGLPLEFPVTSLGETLMRPSTMMYRNLASMDVEETLRANPLDGVVLLAGCDKTTPALLMGAASVDLPSIVLSGGPTLTGRREGRQLPSGTGTYEMYDQVRAGTMTPEDFVGAEACMWRSNGSCNTMGTASTMASLVEVMGMALPGNAAVPAVDARRRTLAHDTGFRAVELVREELVMSRIVTRKAFENAIRLNAAVGGSTNAVVHLLALAGRAEVDLALDDFDRVAAGVPLLVDLVPSGKYLMEDFFDAGGVPVVVNELDELLHREALTVTGRTLGENTEGATGWGSPVVRRRTDPLQENAGIAVLHGNLAPDGAIIKPSAATAELLDHRGPAVVFEDIDDLRTRIDDPDLDVDADSVLVLKGAGPKGYPGMPEMGNLPIPAKLLRAGVTDMVRISDARMSGTAFGAVVLHVAPESAAGGPLSLVETGDMIELDVPGRRLHLEVDDEELARRRAARGEQRPAGSGGYMQLYLDHVTQADSGADLDFLRGRRGSEVPRAGH
ncbi:dihydroxy-acid dehydratase [Streptomyces olivaceus]|uniref:IlvD/Edd family dehydratase n=1 Tax=Streptomyces olivaceus TaxID=47716 RepID=UPI001CC9C031|nr:IlvD/Edd family dehydratase [Streptomyces olivaceus]MBZ6258278.1 dihydroxy-acid dehydratase [Streptomyces olivaceus]